MKRPTSTRHRILGLHDRGEAKVDEFQARVWGVALQAEVFQFQITVAYIVPMAVRYRRHHLPDATGGVGFTVPTLPREVVKQIRTPHPLQNKPQLPWLLEHLQKAAYVRVRQYKLVLDLEKGLHQLVVVEIRRRQSLDRDALAGGPADGAPDNTRKPAAEHRFLELVFRLESPGLVAHAPEPNARIHLQRLQNPLACFGRPTSRPLAAAPSDRQAGHRWGCGEPGRQQRRARGHGRGRGCPRGGGGVQALPVAAVRVPGHHRRRQVAEDVAHGAHGRPPVRTIGLPPDERKLRPTSVREHILELNLLARGDLNLPDPVWVRIRFQHEATT
mmetsp:Transcript_79274/g.230205  ORF Transcript_79274/g.230205 Transcript_79274/m.230205 type:complete len:330 (+) Transcript_79274:1294-2283(+)